MNRYCVRWTERGSVNRLWFLTRGGAEKQVRYQAMRGIFASMEVERGALL